LINNVSDFVKGEFPVPVRISGRYPQPAVAAVVVAAVGQIEMAFQGEADIENFP